MAQRLCPPCNNVLLKIKDTCQLFEHHQNLLEVKHCAESDPGQCPLCRLLWASIKEQSPANVVHHYLDNWNTDVAPDTRLTLRTELPYPLPDNLANIQAEHFDTDRSQRIHIEVCKIVNRLEDSPIGHFGSLSISVPLDSIAAQALRGRNISQSANPQGRTETISITKSWLNKCDVFHRRCNAEKQTAMPDRVVDIRGQKTRLLINQSDMHGIYVALSYSWGDDSSSMLKLRRGSLLALQGEIEFGKLRQSHQHGIQVARELGYDYIWIDALCIIQGDRHDWAKQASRILEIYGNADLTIVAGRSDDSKKGFLESIPAASSASLAQLPYSLGDGRKSSCFIGPPRNRNIGPVSDRAWCFQEALISRRMIVYGEQQLSFRCRERHDFEDGHCELVGPRDIWYNYSFLARHLASPGLHPDVFQANDRNTKSRLNFKMQHFQDSLPASSGIDFQELDLILKEWYKITTEYSSRRLFDPTDNHAALSGIVRLMQQALTSCGLDTDKVRYMAGLWEMDMVDGLLWSSRRIRDWRLEALQAPVCKGRVVRRAPSWSWMALVGPICQRSDIGQRLCRPANPDRKTWSPEPNGWGPSMIEYEKFPDPFHLEVKAYIHEVRISQQRKSEYSTNTIDLEAVTARSAPSIARHTFLLETAGLGGIENKDTACARALFDMEYAGNMPLQMWAMCVTSSEGLLLKQIRDPKYGSIVYERLGIYAVDWTPAHMPTFYPKESLGMDWSYGFYVIEDKLPVETIVLI